MAELIIVDTGYEAAIVVASFDDDARAIDSIALGRANMIFVRMTQSESDDRWPQLSRQRSLGSRRAYGS